MKQEQQNKQSEQNPKLWSYEVLDFLWLVTLAPAPPLVLLMVFLSIFIQPARGAETIDREYTAVLQGWRALETAVGCWDYSAAMSKGYSVGVPTKYGTNKQDVVYVTGYQLRLTCTEYAAQAPAPLPPVAQEKDIRLSWTAPAARMNGAILPADQIAGYQVYRYSEGTFIKIADTAALDYLDAKMLPGAYRYALKTVDIDGLKSPFSAEVTITINP